MLLSHDELLSEIVSNENILIVQDLDGVCMRLVEDPLTREMDPEYIEAVARLNSDFFVLTNGEHSSIRGVNRIVEDAIGGSKIAKGRGLYLPGLAAGGIQYQDRFGNIDTPGVYEKEKQYLYELPKKMEKLFSRRLKDVMPNLNEEEIEAQVRKSIIDTELSPTFNLNFLFKSYVMNTEKKIEIQKLINTIMQELINESKDEGLRNSFFLHIAPNLGKEDGKEKLKLSTTTDIGTTDIQFMVNGAVKESGLLVLINKYVENKTGRAPFGKEFNARMAPKSLEDLINLCIKHIPKNTMPTLIGVGDTVTSSYKKNGVGWDRGGSDRGFLTLIKEIGSEYQLGNRAVLIDSSDGEVNRPNMKDGTLTGITDPEDDLKIDCIFPLGTKDYTKWFIKMSKVRESRKF